MEEPSCVLVSSNILNYYSNILGKIKSKMHFAKDFFHLILNPRTFQKELNPYVSDLFTINSSKSLLSKNCIMFKKLDRPFNDVYSSIHFFSFFNRMSPLWGKHHFKPSVIKQNLQCFSCFNCVQQEVLFYYCKRILESWVIISWKKINNLRIETSEVV